MTTLTTSGGEGGGGGGGVSTSSSSTISSNNSGGGVASSTTALAPLRIARSFIIKYYQTLSTSPESIARFYSPRSFISYAESLTSLPVSIPHAGLSSAFCWAEGVTIDFDQGSIDAQESVDGGILVVVTGDMRLKKDEKKKFVQTFFLVDEGGKKGARKCYFVRNDVFRFLAVENGAQYEQDGEKAVSVSVSVAKTISDDVKVSVNPSLEEVKEEEPETVEFQEEPVPAPPEKVDQEQMAQEPIMTQTQTHQPPIKTSSTPPPLSPPLSSSNPPSSPPPQPQPSSNGMMCHKPATPPPPAPPGSWASLVAKSGYLPPPPTISKSTYESTVSPPAPTPPRTQSPTVTSPPPVCAPPPSSSRSTSTTTHNNTTTTTTATTTTNHPLLPPPPPTISKTNHHHRTTKSSSSTTAPSSTFEPQSLYIKNICHTTTEADLRQLFADFDFPIVNVNLYPQRAFAFVDFDRPEAVKEIMAVRRRFEVRGRLLEVEKKSGERKRGGLRGGGNTMNRRGSGDHHSNRRMGGRGRGRGNINMTGSANTAHNSNSTTTMRAN